MAPYEEIRLVFEAAGQGHVFRFWDDLDDAGRDTFLRQLESVDLSLCRALPDLVSRREGLSSGARIETLEYVAAPVPGEEAASWREAREAGEEALRGGRVGAFLAAGGQGSRLGFTGPKGTFPIGPVSGRSLFQVFAETILAHSRRWKRAVPLVVMTSPDNHEDTVGFFRERRFFGLPEQDVLFRSQSMLPAFSEDGKFLLRDRGDLFMNPDGHGGAFKVFTRGGALEWFRERGVDTVYYFQIDNPLLPVLDPPFLGHHLLHGSDFTTKVVPKTGPEEKMGVLASVDGRTRVVEYIHLGPEQARERDASGRLLFWAGNVAVHAVALDFVESFAKGVELPYHVARKPASVLGPGGEEEERSVLKLETFVFDAIPLARSSLAVEVVREEEFGPVKASEGQDTPKRARAMMVAKAARWLERAGVRIPRGPDGAPAVPIEISPLTALIPEDLKSLPVIPDFTGPVII